MGCGRTPHPIRTVFRTFRLPSKPTAFVGSANRVTIRFLSHPTSHIHQKSGCVGVVGSLTWGGSCQPLDITSRRPDPARSPTTTTRLGEIPDAENIVNELRRFPFKQTPTKSDTTPYRRKTLPGRFWQPLQSSPTNTAVRGLVDVTRAR
jgi:hypothetical protein